MEHDCGLPRDGRVAELGARLMASCNFTVTPRSDPLQCLGRRKPAGACHNRINHESGYCHHHRPAPEMVVTEALMQDLADQMADNGSFNRIMAALEERVSYGNVHRARIVVEVMMAGGYDPDEARQQARKMPSIREFVESPSDVLTRPLWRGTPAAANADANIFDLELAVPFE